MQPRVYSTPFSPDLVRVLIPLAFIPFCSSIPSAAPRDVGSDLHSNYFDPAPAPEDGPAFSAEALRNSAYLPAQIGGIVGSYALSLVIVAALLLLLAKKRREHLTAGEEDIDYDAEFARQFAIANGLQGEGGVPYPYNPEIPPGSPRSPIKNFSWPTPPTPSNEKGTTPYIYPASHSSSTLGINPLVDPRVVAADREMAQQQLEEMYKYVMEQEAAKEAGVTLERPPSPVAKQTPTSAQPRQSILKKGKNKPANLDLSQHPQEPERQSRTASILSALRSPRKKNVKGISISSPIMTPMSGTFPRQEGEEMNAIPPRHYAPASPPPIPGDQQPHPRLSRHPGPAAPLTPPDISPESTQSIDERLGGGGGGGGGLGYPGHSRQQSLATNNSEADPISAVSDRSTAPLVGLPSSPKPGVSRFPSLPSSPKPGATFSTSASASSSTPALASPRGMSSRANAPSAVRTGGALPLRAYEPALQSPTAQAATMKQTTFERAAMLSPRTPWTGAPAPYTPYQPFSPVVPVTPSLVTRADRKRIKQLQPKTPTMEMVKSADEIW